MIKKGIILAGGMGTRMSPLTKAVNKQLLPIYDKPLIFYSLSILMLSKIKNVLIIVNKGQLEQYKKVLPNGKNLGMNISYKEQEKPNGLPEAFLIGKDFIKNDNVALILGDNFFYAQNLTSILLEAIKSPYKTILENAHINYGPNMKEGWGVNVITGQNVDLVKDGIIDPVLVTKTALINAISVATTILSADCVISNMRMNESNQ